MDHLPLGDRAFIGIDESQLLDHPWAGNVVDLCPVGSLLSKDFLHKARAWDLDKSASVCPGCTQGCNINIDTRDDVVVRLRPRPNLEVNRHFICDTGRADYRWLNRGDRIEAPLVRHADRLAATDWDSALDHVAELIETLPGSAVLLASGRAGTESLGLVKRLLGARSHVAAVKVPLGEEAPLAGVSNLALRRAGSGSARGAQLLGYSADWKRSLAALPEAGLIVILDADLDADEQAMIERAPGALIWLGTVLSDAWRRAEAVLPITNMAEENGTYVNRDGRVQRYHQAKGPVGMARPAWWAAGEVLLGRGPDAAAPASGEEAFALLGQFWPVFAGLTHADLGFTGLVLGPVPSEVPA